MRVRKPLDFDLIAKISGSASQLLADRCPDRRATFPDTPCTNLGCDYRIKQRGYMNCTFVASEAGEHTLESIGEMLEITREGVRLIELRALRKIRASFGIHDEATVQKPNMVARTGLKPSYDQESEPADQCDVVPAYDDRKLEQCGG